MPVPACGQVTATDGYLSFVIIPDATYHPVSLAGTQTGPNGRLISDVAAFSFRIKDQSVDPVNAPEPVAHSVTFSIRWLEGKNPYDSFWSKDKAWQVLNATTDIQAIFTGDTSFDQSISLIHQVTALELATGVRLIANMSIQARPHVYTIRTIDFFARIQPSPGIQLQIDYGAAPTQARPDSWVRVPVVVQNTDLYNQSISLRVAVQPGEGVDPGLIPIRGDVGAVFLPQETKTLVIEFKTPKAKTYYGSSSMVYDVIAYNPSNDGIRTSTTGVLIIQGFYLSTQLQVMAFLLVILLILFILVLVRGKRYYDETILGKPIPPWRIKEEALALDKLRKEDPRAFYLARYFLMVEEYESALNWFYSYKRRTKKKLKREAKSERLVRKATILKTPSLDRFDRRAERMKKRIHNRQERQRLKLESKLDRLDKKVDQHFEEDYEKQHEKWEKKVTQIRKKASRPWFKAHRAWEREAEKVMEDWEKPFAKDKERREKEIQKAKDKYEKDVKKKDRGAWEDWGEAVSNVEKENKLREREEREALPLPELVSSALGPPKLPAPFKEPARPKLPPEPEEPAVEGLPAEPKLDRPKLEESNYARKVKRLKKKTTRKVARLERKLERSLAKNERDRVRAIAKANRDREKLLRRSQRVVQPTLTETILRQTPEARERRAHKKLLKALAKERVQHLEEAEQTRLEVMRVEAERREAELLAKLSRRQAEVRKTGGSSTMRVEQDADLLALRATNAERIAKEEAASERKLEAERARIEKDLRDQLTEELIQERAAQDPGAIPAPPAAEKSKKQSKPRRA